MNAILVVGVAVVDFVFHVDEMPRSPEKYRAKDAFVTGGGNAANAACAIARLGGTAQLAGRLGSDMIGDLIVSGLANEGVDCNLLKRFDGARSSYSSVFVDRSGERQIVNFRDMSIAMDPQWLLDQTLTNVGCVLADTRWGPGAEAAMHIARKLGVPGVIDAEAPVSDAIDAIPLASHLAFSAQGLRDYQGTDNLEKALKDVFNQTGSFVCVTDGGNGVYWRSSEGHGTIASHEIEVVDTLGAGDVWHGAFALSLSEGCDEITAIHFANAVAALKCQRSGGRSGYPSRAEVECLIKETQS